jgi:hypothetical protein
MSSRLSLRPPLNTKSTPPHNPPPTPGERGAEPAETPQCYRLFPPYHSADALLLPSSTLFVAGFKVEDLALINWDEATRAVSQGGWGRGDRRAQDSFDLSPPLETKALHFPHFLHLSLDLSGGWR